jgi:hypothetical protein
LQRPNEFVTEFFDSVAGSGTAKEQPPFGTWRRQKQRPDPSQLIWVVANIFDYGHRHGLPQRVQVANYRVTVPNPEQHCEDWNPKYGGP